MPDPTIDAIKSRIDLSEIIGARVALKRAGRLMKGLCPFHQEKSPSFVVYPDEGRYHCFGCGKSGDVFTWFQDTQGLDFADTLKELSRRTGVPIPERTLKGVDAPAPESQASVQALAEASAHFTRQLLDGRDAGEARAYLRRRGVTRSTIEQFGIGWASDEWEGLTTSLVRRGFTFEQLERAGLSMVTEHGRRDRFRSRVMFSIRDPNGQVRGFGGRTLGDGVPKYLNSPQTPFFDKSATLFGLDLAKGPIRQAGQAVIVEGYMDVVLPFQEGFKNVIASLGTALTDRQIELLRRYTRTIVLALDADAAGQAATARGLEVARSALGMYARPAQGSIARGGFLATQNAQLRIAVLSGGKDPDEIVREDPARWKALIDASIPMMDHKIELELAAVSMDEPQSKLLAVREIAKFLVLVPDPVEWSHYIDRIAQRLRLDLRAVQSEVSRAEGAVRQAMRLEAARTAAELQARATDAGLTVGPGGLNVVSPRESSPSELQGTQPAVRSGQSGRSSQTEDLTGLEDPLERFIVEELVADLRLVHHVRYIIGPEDFLQSEWRVLIERLMLLQDGDIFVPDEVIGRVVDRLRASAGRPMPLNVTREAEAHRVPSLVAGARRLRERRLREKIRDAQYLLQEELPPDERVFLQRQVERLASQLGRVHLDQSRGTAFA